MLCSRNSVDAYDPQAASCEPPDCIIKSGECCTVEIHWILRGMDHQETVIVVLMSVCLWWFISVALRKHYTENQCGMRLICFVCLPARIKVGQTKYVLCVIGWLTATAVLDASHWLTDYRLVPSVKGGAYILFICWLIYVKTDLSLCLNITSRRRMDGFTRTSMHSVFEHYIELGGQC